MAKAKGGEGKGTTKTVAERETASKIVKDRAKAESKQREKARVAMGPTWYTEQNATKSSDKESFIAGMTQPYTFPGGDQPSVHLELSYRPNRDGTKRELVVVYMSAHEGHPLVGLNKTTFLKAKWLANGGFKSTADNPSVKKTQDAVIGYLWDFFGGPIAVQNAVIEIEKETSPTKAVAAKQTTIVVTKEFSLENIAETDKAHTGQISFPVKAGKVVITMAKSKKYTGDEWGYNPMNAYLHMDNGSNRCLWDLFQNKEEGFFYNLVQTEGDGFIVVGTKGKGKEKVLFTALSLRSEAEKIEVVGKNGVLELMGGMNILNMIPFKERVASALGFSVRFTDEEMNFKRRIDGAKARKANEEKKEKEFLKAKEAGERQRKVMDDIIANHTVTVYNDRGEELSVLEVESDTVAMYFQPGTHVVVRDKNGAPTHKVVRSRANSKFVMKAEDVTFERPTFEGKAKVLDMRLAYINAEHGAQEITVVPDRQAVVTLRAQGLNGGAYVAYRDEQDGQMVITRVFGDEGIQEIARQKELERI